VVPLQITNSPYAAVDIPLNAVLQLRGEWLRFRRAQSDAELDLSVCFTGFDEVEVQITAWRDHNFTEPDISGIPPRKYNTTEIRKSLGAVELRQPATTRGHLQMVEVNLEVPFNGGDDWNNYQVLNAALGLNAYSQSYFMCTHCETQLRGRKPEHELQPGAS
jgi:hypothetical protein